MEKNRPSNNWLDLKQKLKPKRSAKQLNRGPPSKKRKVQHNSQNSEEAPEQSTSAFPRGSDQPHEPHASSSSSSIPYSPNDDSVHSLRALVEGAFAYTPAQEKPGKFLAIDCEMVGVGIEGGESSLARVSIVNYHGAIQMDEFVRQKERVTDYRTAYSGIRPKDMVKARSFEEIQKQVADLIKDRILIGHAIRNDLKVLLLSHPRPLIRDTQALAGKHKVTKTPRPALRHLVQQELGIAIQGGEHSSVIDARATMAIYRLHRKTWESDMPRIHLTLAASATAKRKHDASELDDDEADAASKDVGKRRDETDSDELSAVQSVKKKTPAAQSAKKSPTACNTKHQYPGGGRKGVSSGLSTVVKRKETKVKTSWWKELGGAKGSVKI